MFTCDINLVNKREQNLSDLYFLHYCRLIIDKIEMFRPKS